MHMFTCICFSLYLYIRVCVGIYTNFYMLIHVYTYRYIHNPVETRVIFDLWGGYDW